MHLAQDLSKADTHFLAITLRRNPTAEPLRSMYALVDAAVLPLTLFDNKFERMQDSFTHSARNPVREALARDMPQLVKEGLLGGVLALYIELGEKEELTPEEAVVQVGALSLQRR